MVPNPRTTAGPVTLQPVNAPEPVEVREGEDGQPLKVRLGHRQVGAGRWQVIASIEDTWRIDDEWWRQEPLSRLYYEAITASGRRLTIFKDLVHSTWYRQNYG